MDERVCIKNNALCLNTAKGNQPVLNFLYYIVKLVKLVI